MTPFTLPWWRNDGRPSLWHDLRSGRAGLVIRAALSIAAAPLALVPVMFVFGALEASGVRVRDEGIAIGMGIGGAIWCGLLYFLWAGYRRWRRAIRTTVVVIGVWALAIPAAAMVARAPRGEEYLVAGVILFTVSITVAIIASVGYRRSGHRIADGTAVRVVCPTCGYSLVGLATCTCPECGTGFTIDALILAQGYEAIDAVADGAPDHDGKAADHDESASAPMRLAGE